MLKLLKLVIEFFLDIYIIHTYINIKVQKIQNFNLIVKFKDESYEFIYHCNRGIKDFK